MTTTEAEHRKLLDTAQRGARAPRAAGVAGILFALLLSASLLAVRGHPGWNAPAEVVNQWYLETGKPVMSLVTIYLMPLAGIAFLWFIAVFRDHVGVLEDRFLSTVFLGSGLLFVSMLFASATAFGAIPAAMRFQDAPAPNAEAIYLARAMGYAFMFVMAMRAAAVFVMVVSSITLRTKVLPNWLGYLGYPIALVLLLTTARTETVVLLFPFWAAFFSAVILIVGRGIPSIEERYPVALEGENPPGKVASPGETE